MQVQQQKEGLSPWPHSKESGTRRSDLKKESVKITGYFWVGTLNLKKQGKAYILMSSFYISNSVKAKK